jgi:hypothetical protein
VYPGAVSSPRDRLGLLLPLPALLITGQAHARAPGSSPSADELHPPPDPSAQPPPVVDDAPATELDQAKALYIRGEEAFRRGDFREAGLAFEQSAALAPMVLLHLHATVAYRYAALAESDPGSATALCEATRRQAEAVAAHPRATPEQIEQAKTEQELADAHCNALPEVMAGPCLSDEHLHCLQPCLNIIEPSRGCGSRRDGSVSMLAALPLLVLRSRRRRDAVERLAERLPPDVVAKLRRNDDEPDEGDR